MNKVLKTLQLLFWGNILFVLGSLYLTFVIIVHVTLAFLEVIMEIWCNDN